MSVLVKQFSKVTDWIMEPQSVNQPSTIYPGNLYKIT